MRAQMMIPGMESLTPPELKPKAKPPNSHQKIAALEERIFKLEVEVTLLRLQLERGDKAHA